MKSLIALCVGHSRIVRGSSPEGGAVTLDGKVNEWTWNCALAELIAKNLHAAGVKSVIVSEYEGNGYGSSQRWLARHLSDLGATAAIELHFNSAETPDARGHEWLYWHASSRGKALAASLSAEMCLSVPSIKSRGAKPKFTGDRGSEFLRLPSMPCCIAEPFFGSSPVDWAEAQHHRHEIALAIANGVLEWED
jgi:N-acetylmuramoyl-L-alanine amidase